MARKTTHKKDRSRMAGLIAFGVTLLGYACFLPFHKPGHYLIGGSIAALVGWLVKTMATPLKGLDKSNQSKDAMNVTIIEDEYARGIVEDGVSLLDTLKNERDTINEYVFTRRINDLRGNYDKLLRQVIEDPDKAHRLRKLNSYYFPTAIKLLQDYRTAKGQGASYMTVSSTREEILAMLDKLIEATASLLDTLLRADLEDIEIEIDVFDRMLKSDGLAKDEVTDALRSSAHAAARDIPMSGAPSFKPEAASAVKPAVQNAMSSVQAAVPLQASEPRPVSMAYQVQPDYSAPSPAPVLEVPVTASAAQLQQGTPVLRVPQSPEAPDFAADAHAAHKDT